MRELDSIERRKPFDYSAPGARMRRFVPVLFVLSVVTGLFGQIVHAASLFVASGVIFGAAMLGVGRQVLSVPGGTR